MRPILRRSPFSSIGKIVVFLFISLIALRVITDVIVILRIELMRHEISTRFPGYGEERLERWYELVLAGKSLKDMQKLTHVNMFFHENVRYEYDIMQYDEEDYWASPVELLGSGSGDCEDWAIAKYMTLKILGVDEDKLRLIYVQYTDMTEPGSRPIAHMVLGYYAQPNAEPWILDSLTPQVSAASKRKDLKPVFSFNSQGLWAGEGNVKSSKSSVAKLSKWRSVLERSNQEGIVFKG